MVASRGFALAGHVGVGDGDWEGSIWSRLTPGVSVFERVHVMNSSSSNRSGGDRRLAGEKSQCGEYFSVWGISPHPARGILPD